MMSFFVNQCKRNLHWSNLKALLAIAVPIGVLGAWWGIFVYFAFKLGVDIQTTSRNSSEILSIVDSLHRFQASYHRAEGEHFDLNYLHQLYKSELLQQMKFHVNARNMYHFKAGSTVFGNNLFAENISVFNLYRGVFTSSTLGDFFYASRCNDLFHQLRVGPGLIEMLGIPDVPNYSHVLLNHAQIGIDPRMFVNIFDIVNMNNLPLQDVSSSIDSVLTVRPSTNVWVEMDSDTTSSLSEVVSDVVSQSRFRFRVVPVILGSLLGVGLMYLTGDIISSLSVGRSMLDLLF